MKNLISERTDSICDQTLSVDRWLNVAPSEAILVLAIRPRIGDRNIPIRLLVKHFNKFNSKRAADRPRRPAFRIIE
jgi:hypothetical protein